jgi:fatty-acyl-CoA synthase
MRNRGIGSWMARRARMTPASLAIVQAAGEGPQTELTYGRLHERTTRLAHALRRLGVGRGDRVAYLGANHPAFLETLFATGTLGAVFVPLNFRLAGPELEFCLGDSGSVVIVHAPEHSEVLASIAPRLAVRHCVCIEANGAGALDYSALLDEAPSSGIDEPVDADEPCMIMYTSGTTGRPKGATLSHANTTWNCFNVLIDIDVASDEVSLVSAPLFHTAALNMLSLPTLLKGGTAVLMSSFDPGRAFDLIETRRVTWMFGVPAMFTAMAQSPRWADADMSSVRILMCGGAPVPEALIRTYEKRGLTFLQGYGMTEAAPGALFLSRHMASKVGSAGKASFFADVRLARGDMSTPGPDEPGEILVQGPNVMKGYWRNQDATLGSFVDGDWFRSGDVGVADDDGFFYVRDRIKDMIISGGENIYPAEVEAVLCQHPSIAECGVIGVPDEKWGEVGRAFVVLKPSTDTSEQELATFMQGKIARYKIPKSFVRIDALPRTGSGKIDKPKLRARV